MYYLNLIRSPSYEAVSVSGDRVVTRSAGGTEQLEVALPSCGYNTWRHNSVQHPCLLEIKYFKNKIMLAMLYFVFCVLCI